MHSQSDKFLCGKPKAFLAQVCIRFHAAYPVAMTYKGLNGSCMFKFVYFSLKLKTEVSRNYRVFHGVPQNLIARL